MAYGLEGKGHNMRIFAVFFHPTTHFTAVGGAEKRFIRVLKIWGTERVSITVVDPDPTLISRNCPSCNVISMPGPLQSMGKGLFSIYLQWLFWIVKAFFLCPSLLKRGNHNVILAPNNTLPNLIIAYWLHLVSGLPLCAIVHHMDFPYADTKANFASVYRVYRRTHFSMPVAFAKALTFLLILALVKRSDICISVSSYTASFLLKNSVSSQKIRVSGNGVDFEIIDRIKVPRKLYEGIFVGRIARDKGVFDLVKVWRRIIVTRPDARLMIVGSGPDSLKLEEIAEKSGVSSKIILQGSCDDSELYTLMKASKTFLFPSMFEGWGLAVGEALACGLPVICYDIPALREIFGECRSAFLVPIGDTRKFAETAENILERKDLDELEKASKEYARRFKWEKVALDDLQIVRSTVNDLG